MAVPVPYDWAPISWKAFHCFETWTPPRQLKQRWCALFRQTWKAPTATQQTIEEGMLPVMIVDAVSSLIYAYYQTAEIGNIVVSGGAQSDQGT